MAIISNHEPIFCIDVNASRILDRRRPTLDRVFGDVSSAVCRCL